MWTSSYRAVLVAAASLAAVGSAMAQGVSPSAPPPSPVGVTAQTAASANDRAVQRTDTGTVVRTSPSAADRASRARTGDGSTAARTGTTDGGMPSSSGMGTTSTTSTTGTAAATGASTDSTRPARADRN